MSLPVSFDQPLGDVRDRKVFIDSAWYRYLVDLGIGSVSNVSLTGPITAAAGVTAIASQTGTGTTFVMQASPTLTGTPAAPTAAPATNSTQIATTAYADAISALKANIASPSFTGTPIGRGGVFGHCVEAYGAVGDGVTNDAAAIQSAINAAATGTNGSNTVRFQSKNYLCNSALSYALNATTLRFVGEGAYGSTRTRLTFAAGVNGLSFTSAQALNSAGSLSNVQVRDLAIESAGGTATGFSIGSAGFQVDSYAKHVIENVLILNFTSGAKQLNTRQMNYLNVVMRSEVAGGQALYMLCDNNACFCGDTNFVGCDFSVDDDASTTSVCCLLEHSSASGAGLAGVHFSGCDFYYGGDSGISILTSSTGTVADIFILSSSQLDGPSAGVAGSVGVRMTNSSTGIIRNIRIGGTFINAFGRGVYLNAGTGTIDCVGITNNFVSDMNAAGGDYAVAVDGAGSQGVSITGNTFRNLKTYGILLNDGKNLTVTGNTHKGAGAVSGISYLVGIGAAVDVFSVIGNTGHATTGAVNDTSVTANKYLAGNLYYA